LKATGNAGLVDDIRQELRTIQRQLLKYGRYDKRFDSRAGKLSCPFSLFLSFLFPWEVVEVRLELRDFCSFIFGVWFIFVAGTQSYN
jgi:hypothetical protein